MLLSCPQHLAIWGVGPPTTEAKRLIKEWIEEETAPQQPQRKKIWAHVPSLNPDEKRKLYRKLDDESKRQRFRRAPPVHNTTEPEMVHPFYHYHARINI